MGKLSTINDKAGVLKEDIYALYLSAKDPRTPAIAKAGIVLIVAYILSPLDIVPDFIPFVGWLDDFVILTLGFRVVKGLIPPGVWEEAKRKAAPTTVKIKQAYKILEIALIIFWVLLAASIAALIYFLVKGINSLFKNI